MGKQIFNIKGMMRDLDPAKSPNQYAYEIRNLRLTAQEDSTLLALTTEKGNIQYTLTGDSITGDIVGYCALGKYITIFTHHANNDYIYRLEESLAEVPTIAVTLLYSGDLGFTSDTKIEALGVYENENIQKVYWIDGVNQPRVINIKDTNADYSSVNTPFDFIQEIDGNQNVSISKVPYSGSFPAGTIQYILVYYNKNGQQSNAFYISPLFYVSQDSRGGSPEEVVNDSFQIIIKNPSNKFDFVRVYSVQRTSENGTPICKRVRDIRVQDTIEMQTSGIKRTIQIPELSVSTSEQVVNINDINNLKLFYIPAVPIGGNHWVLKDSHSIRLSEYLIWSSGSVKTYRIPSGLYLHYFYNNTDYIYTGSMGLTFSVDIKEKKMTIPSNIESGTETYIESTYIESTACLSIIDNGINNESTDFSEILYAGGSAIIPNAIEQKGNTLFFGNYSYKSSSLTSDQISSIKDGVSVTFANSERPISKGTTGSYYMYQSQFDKSAEDITTFKSGETYRFGFILYNNLGEKTSVIDLGEVTNDCYPIDLDTEFLPVKAYIVFPSNNMAYIRSLGYTSIQCVVKDNKNYDVIAQGALCPTLYKMNDRKDGSMFSVSSWFFRDLQRNTRQDYTSGSTIIRRNSYETLYYRIGSSGYEYSTNPSDPSAWNVITKIIHNHRIRGTQNIHNQNISSFVDDSFFGSGTTPWFWSAMPDSEIMGASENDLSAYDPRIKDPNYSATYRYNNRDFFIDWNTITFHSPDIEFDRISSLNDNYDLKIIGLLPLTGVITKHILETKDGSTPYHTGIRNFTEHQVWHSNIQQSGNEISLSDYCWTDGKSGAESGINYYPIFPWQRNASLAGSQTSISGTDDWRGLLGYNIRSSIRTSSRVFFLEPHSYNISKASIYHDDSKVIDLGNSGDIFAYTYTRLYSGEVQEALTDSQSYSISYADYNYTKTVVNNHTAPVSVKYKSRPHAILSLGYDNNKQIVLPSLNLGEDEQGNAIIIGDTPTSTVYPMWQTGNSTDFTADGVITQDQIDASAIPSSYKNYGFIYLAELRVKLHNPISKDGTWNSGSSIQNLNDSKLAIEISYGDTYYQRYDCLKTYPYSMEDQNQIVEILSFMCETKLNIDGRYDIRRGQSNNTTVNNSNFNLLNKAYTQDDNFITYSYLDVEDYSINNFPNQIIWTKTKVFGNEVDDWTQIIPSSILDMDGTLGEVQALKLWDDNLMCFQDRGISKIMYNERTTISTQQGVPIEIANSGKVDGSQYISNQIGCSNKDSIQVTQAGIYFIDDNTKEIYRWSKGLESLSKGKGFNTYLYNNVYINTEKTFYDPKLKDVYFQFGGECLIYNEQLAEFTSFLDYDMKFMLPLKDSLIAIKNNSLWKQFEGDYLSFFGVDKGYSIDIISSEQPTTDKIFSTIEFRADVLDGSIQEPYSQQVSSSLNILPFTKIRVWNEYQDTQEVDFERQIRRGTGANLAQKFRIWRGDIPRVNGKPLERIRNPWARIKLSDAGSNKKTVVHDIAVTYF